jgi:hypothetical protein
VAHDTHRKVKGQVHPTTGHEDPELEHRYYSNLSLTSVLDDSGCSPPRPSRFTPEKRPGTDCIGRSQGRPGPVRKISPSQGLNIRTFPPVATRYTISTISRPTILLWCQASKSNPACKAAAQCSLCPVRLVALTVRDQSMDGKIGIRFPYRPVLV